jgi:hypothetical protein
MRAQLNPEWIQAETSALNPGASIVGWSWTDR